MLYPARGDDLGLTGTEPSWDLGISEEGIFLKRLVTPGPTLFILEDVRKPARKGKHVRTFLFGISHFQFCIISIYIAVF